MNNIHPATPAKLKSGAWGARVQGAVSVGDQITISTKSGKTWNATVSTVVWTDGSISLCATSGTRSGGSHSTSRRTGCSCGSRDGIIQASDCWSCKHDAE